MRHFLFALLLFSALILPGCTRAPEDCGSVPPAKLSNCIYVKAVMGQDPFRCYSIPDMNQRAICIKDASDPSARTSLQRAIPKERDSIFAEPESPPLKANATAAPAPQPPLPKADSYCHDRYPGFYNIGDTECNLTRDVCPCWDATNNICLPQSACT